ncbi:MAG: hypothetical protein ACLPOO_11940 [Terriglobales bacterium]|jgi:hypothetical protein
MPSATIESLRAVNHSLRARLARLTGEPNRPAVIGLTELTDLRAELLRATGCLRSLQAAAIPNAEMADDISEYRSHVHQFGKILPSVQARLLIEKARLDTARAHVAKAAAWAQGSKEMLASESPSYFR